MLRKIMKLIKMLIPVTLGVFIGSSVEQWDTYRAHPEIYMTYSAPWYTQILADALLLAVIVLLEAALYLLLKYFDKKRRQQ